MGLRTIYCGRQTVRVIEPNGQARRFYVPISTEHLLMLYPHHYVRHVSGSILSMDAELESGSTYLLLPLPRLFPCSPPCTIQSPCPCFSPLHSPQAGAPKCRPSIWSRRGLKGQWGSNSDQSSKVSPQAFSSSDGSFCKRKTGNGPMRSRLWEPSLDIILENNMLLQTKEEESAKSTRKAHDHKRPGQALIKSKSAVYKCKNNPWDNIPALVPSAGFIF